MQAEELFTDNCAMQAWELLESVKDSAQEQQSEKIQGLLEDIESACFKKCYFMRLEHITAVKCIFVEKSEGNIVYSFDTAEDMQRAGRDYDSYLVSHFQHGDGHSGIYSDSFGNSIKAVWSLSGKNISIEISLG